MNVKKWLALLIVFVIIGCAVFTVYAAALEAGDKGPAVTEVQSRLKKWGYYAGAIDGKYGAATARAVSAFQRKNGLRQTGKVDDITAEKLGVQKYIAASANEKQAATKSLASQVHGDVDLLARLIYAEARGEPQTGKVAVAAVVMNRVRDARFPASISAVINQPSAFSCVKNGQINNSPDDSCIRAAQDAFNGSDPTSGCVFFYNPNKTKNSFLHSLKTVTTIGNHIFAK